MTYEINYNAQHNGYEVTFDGKPSEEVRTALKALKFRWHSVKRCWYGYGCSEETIAEAIVGASTEEAPNTVIGDGYLGGGSIYGSKSNHHLYGTDLSAAIRADVKAAGLKGITVKCKTYSGGQSITATVKIQPSDYISHFVRGHFRTVGVTCRFRYPAAILVHLQNFHGAHIAGPVPLGILVGELVIIALLAGKAPRRRTNTLRFHGLDSSAFIGYTVIGR